MVIDRVEGPMGRRRIFPASIPVTEGNMGAKSISILCYVNQEIKPCPGRSRQKSF
jgi:hypothetical protein